MTSNWNNSLMQLGMAWCFLLPPQLADVPQLRWSCFNATVLQLRCLLGAIGTQFKIADQSGTNSKKMATTYFST